MYIQQMLLIQRGDVTLFAIFLREINSLLSSIDFQKWSSFVLTFLDYMTYLGTENFSCYCCKGLARRSQRFQVLMLSIKNYYG